MMIPIVLLDRALAGWANRTRDPISVRLNLVQLGVGRPVVLARRSRLA